MKKTFAILLAFLLFLSAAVLAFAQGGAPSIVAQPAATHSGEQIAVPIRIENNPGVMGFAVRFDYDPAVLQPVKVEKGAMLNGLFEDNIGAEQSGKLTVYFTGSDDFTADGELFTVTFSVLSLPEDGCQVQIGILEDDTFNEQWQGVALTCEPLHILNADFTTEPATDEPATDEPTEPQPEPPAAEKLSVRIRNWAAGLPKPLDVVMKVVTAPLVWLVSLFEGKG